MKTTINTKKSIIRLAAHKDGLTEFEGGKRKFFYKTYTTNACGFSYAIKIPFLVLFIDIYNH